jgi:hypothetical protein
LIIGKTVKIHHTGLNSIPPPVQNSHLPCVYVCDLIWKYGFVD